MNTKRLLDKILDKWPAKIICLVIAIFLYFFHQASLIDSKTFVVPLEIIESGRVMHVGDVPTSVSVTVRATEENIKAVLPNDITATINLNTITQKGTYKLPVHIKLSESLLTYDPFEVKLKDETITLEVDCKIIRYVPLMPSVVGDVAHGYEIDTISMNPSTVEIYGPESVVNATEQVYTTRINVSNAEKNFSTETSYQEPNKLLSVLDEGPFKAEITVKPKVMEREFEDVEIEVMYLDTSLEIKDEIPLVTLKLSGNMTALEDYVLSKHAVQLSLYEITEPGVYTIPLRYMIPSNFKLIEKSDEELTVTVVQKSESPEAEEGAAGQNGEGQ